MFASHENITIPVDSNVPERRLRLMEKTEQNARADKVGVRLFAEELHRKAYGEQRKLGRSSSLSASMLQLDYEPWYDRKAIRKNIIHESIANSKETRKRFESESDLILSKAIPISSDFQRQKSPKAAQHNREVFAKETDLALGYRRPNGILLYGLSNREQQILSFFKENMDVIHDLGITIPRPLQALMDGNGRTEEERSAAELLYQYDSDTAVQHHSWEKTDDNRKETNYSDDDYARTV
ncbi:unnamed protein product [Gongylonema pulchrum]|uniref:Uncharacterized protein n=1 Tax=Gongylonema pulchrum TaxID=637853 RepID=A0A3P6PH05_9BILA|nr:unnamed protein product [Gongylonema pulchrum]